MRRIDVHVHAQHAALGADGKPVPPLFPYWKQAEADTPEEIIRVCRGIGIERVFALDIPEITFESADAFGDFVVPIPMVDPEQETPDTIDAYFRRGARGIKFIAPGKPYGDDSYFPLYQAIADHDGCAVFHTGYLVNEMFEPGGLCPRRRYSDICAMRPATLDRIARRFPHLRILMAHFGNPWWEEAWKVTSAHSNIRADLSGGTACRRDMRMWEWIFSPNGETDLRVLERLCFGTDACPFHLENYLKTPHFAFYDHLYEHLKLSRELCDRINYGNALELIGE